MPYDHWMTDPKIIELARNCMDSIDYDAASNQVAQQYVRAETFCVHPDEYKNMKPSWYGTVKENGLTQSWHGNVWLNPPYSAGNIDRFVNKAVSEWRSGEVDSMLVLVNSATDTRWYHKLLKISTCALLWQGRIKFWKIQEGQAYEKWEGEKSKKEGKNKIGNSPRYLNTLFYFTYSDLTEFNRCFGDKGTVIRVAREDIIVSI